ncbi:MAG: DUF1080 domain-containing protein [Phycisphaerales bacterium]|nr:DUF1080 domain-containing protein [Phycisphaerales bacterium]
MNNLIRLIAGSTVVLLLSLAVGSPVHTSTHHLHPVFGPDIELFNGKNLDGWRGWFRDGSTDLSQSYSVKDGVLVCQGQPIGYIQTDRLYENYELIVEWRFDPEKGAGNSGVLLRVIGEDKVWPNCIEGQLHSTHAGDIWNIGEFPMKADEERTRGRNTKKAHESSEKPLGEWNQYRILMDRGNLVLRVNDVVQNKATECREIPGRIALQSEGAHIEFRRVTLRPIVSWTVHENH